MKFRATARSVSTAALVLSAAVAAWCAGTSANAQISSASIEFTNQYIQISDSATSPYMQQFSADIQMRSASDFDGGMITWAGSLSPQSFIYQKFSPSYASLSYFSTPTTSLSDFATEFPSGAYKLTATNSATTASQSVSIDSTTTPPSDTISALTAKSFEELQGLNANSDVLLQIIPIETNPAAQTNYSFQIDDLDNGNTVYSQFSQYVPIGDMTMPAGTLSPNHDYYFDIGFDENYFVQIGDIEAGVTQAEETFGLFSTSGAPEPSSWAIMLAGMAGLGAALRLRTRSLVRALGETGRPGSA